MRRAVPMGVERMSPSLPDAAPLTGLAISSPG
jgi:hypothetical protein